MYDGACMAHIDASQEMRARYRVFYSVEGPRISENIVFGLPKILHLHGYGMAVPFSEVRSVPKALYVPDSPEAGSRSLYDRD